jgi:thiol:disulfide interchange protein DsbD
MGWVLIGIAAYFLNPLLPETVSVLLLAAVALAATVHLGWRDCNAWAIRGF